MSTYMDIYVPPTMILKRVLSKREDEFVCLVHLQTNNTPFIVRGIYLHFMDQAQLEALSRMKQLLEEITHPTLIKHLEINKGLANRYLIYSEYCELGSLEADLAHRREDNDHIDELLIWEYIAQLVDLTIYMVSYSKIDIKELGGHFFLYRFFKPSNIFICPNGCIKTGDYGLFMPPTKRTETFRVGKWIHYIAPEVFHEHTAYLKSAVFSLGCLIYAMCTLHDVSLYNIQEIEVDVPKVSPSLVIPAQYSIHLRNLMHDMLKINPNDRITFKKIAQCKQIEEARYRVRGKMWQQTADSQEVVEPVPTVSRNLSRLESSPSYLKALDGGATDFAASAVENDDELPVPDSFQGQRSKSVSRIRRQITNPVITERGIENPQKHHLYFLRTAGMPKKYLPKYKSTTNVLHYAASTRNLELLERRLDFVGGFDDEGRTALMICIEVNFMKGFLILLNYEARKRCKRTYKYESILSRNPNALTIAAIRGELDFAKLLYDKEGADQNPDGLTPLMCAAINNKVDVVKFLVMKQSRLRSQGGRTALMHAAEHGSTQAVETLCAWEIGLQDDNGSTALMLAAINGHLSCVRKLCNMEGNTRNKNNLLAIDLVNQKRYPQVYKALSDVEG